MLVPRLVSESGIMEQKPSGIPQNMVMCSRMCLFLSLDLTLAVPLQSGQIFEFISMELLLDGNKVQKYVHLTVKLKVQSNVLVIPAMESFISKTIFSLEAGRNTKKGE